MSKLYRAVVALVGVGLLLAAALPAGAMPARPVPAGGKGGLVAAAQVFTEAELNLLAPEVNGRYPGKGPPLQGTANLPVLLIQYSGQTGQQTTGAFFNMLFPIQTYPTGSMNDYYREVSYYNLSLWGTVYGWFTASQPEGYYVNGLGGMSAMYPRNSQGLVREAVLAADPTVDFSQFDNDGPDHVPNSGDDDGYVDCVIVVYNGYAGEYYNPPNPQGEMWSHMWWLSSGLGPGPIAVDGVLVDMYTIQSELRGTAGSQIRDIGVFCHEFGHALGLPDFYPTSTGAWQNFYGSWLGLGEYCLMAYGGWGAGGTNPDQPHHLCGFAKAMLGWANVVHVTVDLPGASIPAVENGNTVYTNFPFFKNPGIDFNYPAGAAPPSWVFFPPGLEGWLVENRQQGAQFDSGLPGSGLLIYHLDGMVGMGDYDGDGLINWLDNDVEWSETRPLLDLECADQTGTDHTLNADDLDAMNNAGDSGDFFRLGNATTFDMTSNPSSVYYSGVGSQFAVRNVGATGSTMTADILVGVPGGSNHDVWVKDCVRDTGAEPSSPVCDCLYYRQQHASPDVWVDNNNDGVIDAPVRGCPNRLYVKVRNLGPQPADYATLEVYDLYGLNAPPLPPAPNPGNPFTGMARVCSLTVLSLLPGDSTTVQVWWNVPMYPLPAWPPNLGLVVWTASDTLNGTGSIDLDNNLAMCTGKELAIKAGQPTPKTGPVGDTDERPGKVLAAKRARLERLAAKADVKDEPAEPLFQEIPINNPYEFPREITLDIEMELPPGWTVTWALPEYGGFVTPPVTILLPPLAVTSLQMLVEPGAAPHGETASVAVLEYLAELYPLSEGLIGSMTLPLRVDLRPPLPVTNCSAEVSSDEPCVPDLHGVLIRFDPVEYDVSGLWEDIGFYGLWRDTVPDVDIDIEALLGKCAATPAEDGGGWTWVDGDWPLDVTGPTPWYRIAAVDKAGNVSEPSEAFCPSIGFDYLDHACGSVRATVTDQGSLGYMELVGRGHGFQFPQGDPSLLFMGSLWAGCDPSYVANRDYTAEGPGDWGRSADPAGHLQKDEDQPGQTGDHEGILGYFDDRGGPLPHGWLVMQKSLSWPDEPFDDFVLLTYRFRNVSEVPLAGLYLGLFCDWDVANPFSNNGGVDLERNLAYLWSDPGHPYVGICLLTPAEPANLAFIHNPTYLHPTDFITDADKYGFLEGSLGVGSTPAAADWSMIVSAGPFDLQPGGTADVCFAVLAGTNKIDLQANADAARNKLDQLLTGVGEPATPLPAHLLLEANVPNPFNPVTEIHYSLPQGGHVRVDVYDLMGRKVVTLFDGEQPAGPQSLTWRAQGVSSGTYLALVRTGGETAARKMLLLK